MIVPGGLPVIIVDDDPAVCNVLAELVKTFYVWGDVLVFTDSDKALDYCRSQEMGVAIFIIDVFLEKRTGFSFLDSILPKFPMAQQDTVMVTGDASDEVVDMCVASDITYLLEKPIRPYALQLAVRAIVSKYVKFAKRLLLDPTFAEHISGF